MSFPAADPLKIPIDSNGNLTTKAEGTDNWTYTWNAENQLTKVEKNGVEVVRFAYDPVGRRVEKIASGATTTWTYEGKSILRLARASTVLSFVNGRRTDEPLAYDDGFAMTYFHADALGSVVGTTSAGGTVTLARRYDAWGNLQTSADTEGYSFTGREWDPEPSLYYYRARYYDAKAGRFISEDPIRFHGGANFYLYVGGFVPNATDPSGLVIKRCFRPLAGRFTPLLMIFYPVPPIPNGPYCPFHEYIYNTETGGSKGHGPWEDRRSEEPQESGKDICYTIPEPTGQCVWESWKPGGYNFFTNNCQTAVNDTVRRCTPSCSTKKPPTDPNEQRPCPSCAGW